jgi:hypothetical protein
MSGPVHSGKAVRLDAVPEGHDPLCVPGRRPWRTSMSSGLSVRGRFDQSCRDLLERLQTPLRPAEDDRAFARRDQGRRERGGRPRLDARADNAPGPRVRFTDCKRSPKPVEGLPLPVYVPAKHELQSREAQQGSSSSICRLAGTPPPSERSVAPDQLTGPFESSVRMVAQMVPKPWQGPTSCDNPHRARDRPRQGPRHAHRSEESQLP